MNPPSVKLNSLTGLRFYLAVFVMLFHAFMLSTIGIGKHSLPPELMSFLNLTFNGTFAVSSFFILSGFVMWYSYSDRQWTFREFIANRIARLYPLYLLGVLAVLFRWHHITGTGDITTQEALHRLILSLLMLQSWSNVWNATQMFNGPGWTLSVEAFFYITFPFLFWIEKSRTSLFNVICVAITSTTLFLLVFGNSPDPNIPHRIINLPFCLRHWGFFTLGILLCKVWKRGITCKIDNWLVATLLLFGYQSTRWLNSGVISMIIPAIIISVLATADTKKLSSPWFSSPIIILGGEISYAIYILHMPLQISLLIILYHSGFGITSDVGLIQKMVYIGASSAITLVVSYLAWRLIEVPGRKWLAERLSGKSRFNLENSRRCIAGVQRNNDR